MKLDRKNLYNSLCVDKKNLHQLIGNLTFLGAGKSTDYYMSNSFYSTIISFDGKIIDFHSGEDIRDEEIQLAYNKFKKLQMLK